MTVDVFAASADWEDLTAELKLWSQMGRQASFWWRDDDAVQPSPPLERLLGLANDYRIPLALAVIPRKTGVDLASRLQNEDRVTVVQHGFAHINHAQGKGRASEFGPERSREIVCAELCKGWELLSALFADQALPWLTPPWNRIAEVFIPLLPGLGYQGLSGFAGEPCQHSLAQLDVHCDVVKWRPAPHFRGEQRCLYQILSCLQRRRQGALEWPIGLLTHHLDHDEACFAFVEQFFVLTQTHPAVRWMSLRNVAIGNADCS